MPPEMKTVKLSGVQLFAPGVWNGLPFTPNDIAAMHEDMTALIPLIRPYIKLGHDVEQPLTDGMPRLGTMASTAVDSKDVLSADFNDVAALLGDLVQVGAYTRVSIELWSGPIVDGVRYRWLIESVAFLGAEVGAVTSIEDIPKLYRPKDEGEYTRVEFDEETRKQVVNFALGHEGAKIEHDGKSVRHVVNFSHEDFTKTDKENPMPFKVGTRTFDTPEALHAFAVEQSQEVKTLTQEVEDGKTREGESKTKLDTVTAEFTKFKDKAMTATVEQTVDALITEGRIPPKMREKIVRLAIALDADDKHEFTVDEKTENSTLRETLLSLFSGSKVIDFTEKAPTGKKEDADTRTEFERDRDAVKEKEDK